MWTPENIAALCTGIAGVIGSVTALAALFRHVTNPDAHQPPAGGGGTSTPAS